MPSRSPIHRRLVLLFLAPAALCFTHCNKKEEAAAPTGHKPPAAAEEAYASGFRKQQQDNFEGAIIQYTKAIELDPLFVDAYRNRGDARRDKGDNEGAIEDYTKVMQLDSKNSIACKNRGLVRTKTGDLDGALADLTKAIEINPNFDVAYSSRGDVRTSKGDFAGAIEDFTKAIQLTPQEGASFRGRGKAKFEQGDFEGAIADYTKSIELEPKISSTFQARGLAYACLAQWPKAAADFDKAWQAATSNLFFALYRWVAQTRAGQDGAPDLRAALSRSYQGREGADDWQMKIARFILERLEEQELMVAASSGGSEKSRTQTCQAWCYAGFVRLVADQKTEAIDCFKKSLETDRKELTEYRLAKDELARLEGKK